jgi:hypothetical protein
LDDCVSLPGRGNYVYLPHNFQTVPERPLTSYLIRYRRLFLLNIQWHMRAIDCSPGEIAGAKKSAVIPSLL